MALWYLTWQPAAVHLKRNTVPTEKQKMKRMRRKRRNQVIIGFVCVFHVFFSYCCSTVWNLVSERCSVTLMFWFIFPRSEHDKCAICLDNYSPGDEIKTLPCLHMYHSTCIENWLRQSRLCPVCKHSIVWRDWCLHEFIWVLSYKWSIKNVN